MSPTIKLKINVNNDNDTVNTKDTNCFGLNYI